MTKSTEARAIDYRSDPDDHSGSWSAVMVVNAYENGEKIPWRLCPGQTLVDVAVWADRHDANLLRKVRAAIRRRMDDDRPAAPGYRMPPGA